MKTPLPQALEELAFLSVTAESKEVRPGAIFVAVRGVTADGHRFILQALQAGATAIVGEEPSTTAMPEGNKTPYFQVADTRRALAYLADKAFGHPSRAMIMVGVTGTAGKTTTTYLVESILRAAGRRVGLIGTVNFRFEGTVLPSTHTTPGAVELQKLLAEMRQKGCDAVVMEVSSHALKQQRVGGVAFDAMVFTNLTPEHLDFHPDMEDYFASKALLFTEAAAVAVEAGKKPFAAVNADDEWGKKLLALLKSKAPKGLRYEPYRVGSSLRLSLEGIRGEVAGTKIDSKLIGRFNAYNILAAVTAMRGLGINAAAVAKGVADVAAVPGRVEAVPNSKGIHVLVDYAHKSDALEKVLATLKQALAESNTTRSRLITVFGCGGDRDRTKRPVMGKIAMTHSDHVFVTSDNPRTEDPSAIIAEILIGITDRTRCTVEPDRALAIRAALKMARPGDLVLIAGKGHEDYQILSDGKGGTKKIHFDDREVAAEALR
jgi:UDP-N-acetylmuramoyl-L-alanyl-D-glutamate--2,6-diaminopimelate ligase